MAKYLMVAMGLLTLTAWAAEPEFRFGSPFTDHAVLQRDKPVTIRGFVQPGSLVEVEFAGQKVSCTGGEDGRWAVTLAPMSASKEPRVLSATASLNGGGVVRRSLKDILVGEVWLASGQSNMEMPLWHPTRKRFRDKMGALMMQWSSNRNFRVMMTYPERGVANHPRAEYPVEWSVPSAEWLATNKYSALAYYFGRELKTTLDVPVGVIAAFWGGTEIKSWVPDSGWDSVRDEPYVVTNVIPMIAERNALGAEVKRRWPKYPGDIYNEQVAALAPYTVRGMIWYQGESNIDENHAGILPYSKNMRALLRGWRTEFGCPDMPILYVELAQFFYPWLKLPPNDERLAELCDEQVRFAREEEGAFVTCIADVGDVNDIHPARKLEVGIRLAALAFEHVYGLPVKADPPQAVKAELVAPGKVVIDFEHGEGLYRWMDEVSLWTERQHESSPVRFVSEDGTVADCESEIVTNRLVVTCERIAYPAFVTYLRRCTDTGNIYNFSALPLGTFKLPVVKAADFNPGERIGDNVAQYDHETASVHEDSTNEPPADAIYRNADLDIETRIDDVLTWMTPYEKMKALHSCGWASSGNIKRLGLAEFRTIDGGSGPRCESRSAITYMPCGIAWAAMWDNELAAEVGRASGAETRGLYTRWEGGGNARMLLGPGGNLGGRTPFGARSFEYMGEDPLLAGRTAANFIRGLQEFDVAPCMKHYVLNDHEWHRTVIDVTNVSERALRELYVRPFEIAIKEGGCWAIMNSYNAVRGEWMSWNRKINDILYRDIGWDGALLADWGGYRDDIRAINGGTTLETLCGDNPVKFRKELKALEDGTLDRATVDDQVRRALRLYFRVGAFDHGRSQRDLDVQARGQALLRSEKHRDIAYRAAAESMVLLENRGGYLPVEAKKIRIVAVVGPNADQYHTMIDGSDLKARGGSGAVKAGREITPLEGFVQVFGERNVLFAPGFRFENADRTDSVSVRGKQAMDPLDAARAADLVVFCGGYDHSIDREVIGWGEPEPADRDYLTFKPGPNGESQEELIRKIAAVNPNVVVAVTAGGPFTTEGFRDVVKAVIVTWYAGESGGRVLADIVTGAVNPSGKLPYTFGRKPTDWPSVAAGAISFPGVVTNRIENSKITSFDCTSVCDYRDGIWVGYRGFDHYGTEPLYPFGYGLSYSVFAIEPVGAKDNRYTVKVTNVSARAGREVVQCYLGKPAVEGVEMPVKELVDYASVELAAGESKLVTFEITDEMRRYWDERTAKWTVPTGKYRVLIGDSAANLPVEF